MHVVYLSRGVHQDLPDDLIDDIENFTETHPTVINDIEELLTGEGILNKEMSIRLYKSG